MKRKIEDNGESNGPPSKHMFGSGYPYGGWQNNQGNMHGGNGCPGGTVGGFRAGRDGHWQSPRMSNNLNGHRGYFRGGGRGRGGPPRYSYDNSQQPYQNNVWHQHFSYDQINNNHYSPQVDSTGGSIGNYSTVGRTNCGGGASNCSENGRANTSVNDSASVHCPITATCGSSSGVVVVEESYTKTKVKRRPMSQSYPTLPWNREDAEKALAAESIYMKDLKNQSLIIRFPDPELNKDLVKKFHPGIEKVHFQVPSGPRYCFVQLSENSNTDKIIKELQQIKFGNGKLEVERKFSKDEDHLSPEGIDPYTLYIGNLPTNIQVANVVEKFPTAMRIDIGFAQRMKFTRYAFIRYPSVDAAIEAYKLAQNLVMDSRSIIVRFRRERGPVGLPGESRPQNSVKQPFKKDGAHSRKEKEKVREKAKERERGKEKEELKQVLDLIVKPKLKCQGSEDEDDEDDDGDDSDDESDDESDEDDDDEDDSEEDDDDEDNDDDDDDDDKDDKNEADGNDADDDSDDKQDDDDDDDDDDEDNDDDDENIDLSRHLFQQIDEQIRDLGSIQ